MDNYPVFGTDYPGSDYYQDRLEEAPANAIALLGSIVVAAIIVVIVAVF